MPITHNIFKGRIDGHIPKTIRGSGFGWDPMFVPEGKDFSFAECSSEVKDELSMRKIALNKMRKHFHNNDRTFLQCVLKSSCKKIE